MKLPVGQALDPVSPPAIPTSGVTDLFTTAAGWITSRPWLAVPAVAMLTGLLVGRVLLVRWRHRRLHRRPQLVTITPPPEVAAEGALTWWATLGELLQPSRWRRLVYGMPHVGFEYRWTGRQLTIAVWLPGTVPATPVAAAVRGAWPGASATITPATPPLPVGAVDEGGALAPALPAWYRLRTDHDTDPLRPLISELSGLATHEHACVQILTRPATPRQVRRLRRGTGTLRTGTPPARPLDPTSWARGLLNLLTPGPAPRHSPGHVPISHAVGWDPQRDRDARAAVDKLTDAPLWHTTIRYAIAHTNPRRVPPDHLRRRLRTLAHATAAAYGIYTARQHLRRQRVPHPAKTLTARVLSGGFLLGTTELAALAALPRDLAVPGLARARAKPMPAPVDIPTGGRGTKVLGRAQVGGHSVALPVVDARQHLHVLGATGVGKSTFLANLILDDITAGRGVVVIDPKGDLVTDIIDRLPASLAEQGRVVILDPDQDTGGARFNPLAGHDHDLVVDNIVSIFSKIFQRHWGPRIDDTLRVACLTLMRHAGATLTLIPPLLNDKHFRARFTNDLTDPEGLLGFWTWYETMPAHVRAQVIGPVNARLRAFLLREFPRRTLGTHHATFNISRVLDRGGILLARLPKGQIGEDTTRLMGSFVLASAWQAATARARMPETTRRDATIVIDECHNFLNLPGSVDDMLAEARGYRLSLVLAHQHLGQLPRDTQLAISTNARNKIVFNVGPEDAKTLARHTLPELDEHDLAHLDAYQAAARLIINNRETAAFTLATRPPRPAVGEPTAVRRAVAELTPPDADPSPLQRIAHRSTADTTSPEQQ